MQVTTINDQPTLLIDRPLTADGLSKEKCVLNLL